MEINFNENRYRKFNIPRTIKKTKKTATNIICKGKYRTIKNKPEYQ